MAVKISSKYITRKGGDKDKKKKKKKSVAQQQSESSKKAGKEGKTTTDVYGKTGKRESGSVAVSSKAKHKTTEFKKTPGYDPKTGEVKGQGEHRTGVYMPPAKRPTDVETTFSVTTAGRGGSRYAEGKSFTERVEKETVKQTIPQKGASKGTASQRRKLITSEGKEINAPMSVKGRTASEMDAQREGKKKKPMKGKRRKKVSSRRPKF